jgi:hypothetical protein
VSHASIIRDGHRSEGEGWCACDVQFGQSQWLATLQVSRVVKHLTTLVDSAAADGFALDASQGDYFAIDLTLSGDVDSPPILTFLRGVIEQHDGLLYDEVAGFKATQVSAPSLACLRQNEGDREDISNTLTGGML